MLVFHGRGNCDRDTMTCVASKKNEAVAAEIFHFVGRGRSCKVNIATAETLPDSVMSASPWRSHSSEGDWIPQSCFGNV